MKDQFEHRLDDSLDDGLCDSIRHSGNTQLSRAALCIAFQGGRHADSGLGLAEELSLEGRLR